MLNFPEGATVRRYCSIPYRVDAESGLVVACRNEPIGTVSGGYEGIDGEFVPIDLEICAYHVERYGLKDEGPFSLDKPK